MSYTTLDIDKYYYGQYGGCFISDAFSISCDLLYEDYKRVAAQEDFWPTCRDIASHLAPMDIRVEEKLLFGKEFQVHKVVFNPYPIIGHALMAKRTGRLQVLFAPRYADEAVLCAKVCGHLDLRLKMNLPLSLRKIETLTRWLEYMDVKLETKLCETFDHPEMFAFQEWIASPDNTYCLYSRSNTGAFPGPLMTTTFATPYGATLKEVVGIPDAIVVPCISGSTALTILKPWFGDDVELHTVEIHYPNMWEDLDSFCGAFTKVVRNQTQDRVIAPELASVWDRGIVTRGGVEEDQAVEALKKVTRFVTETFSLESAAALHYASGLSGNVLVVCGELRMGASL